MQRDTTSRRALDRVDVFIAAAAVILTGMALHHLRTTVRHASPDVLVFYGPWYEHILQYGRWSSLEGSYANYNPPYLYILSLISWVHAIYPNLSPVTAVKLAQLPGLAVMGWLFWSICRRLGCTQRRSLLAAWIAVVAPEVVQNTILWGQCDVLHTACLLGMVRLMLSKRPGWAMVMLGVAMAFKLQAIFVGAAVAALFLSGEVPLWAALCVPAGYIAMMVPAYLAGRPWKALLLIYREQFQYKPDLAADVANPYELIYHFSRTHHTFYMVALRGGFLLAGGVTLWLVVFLMRSPWRLRGERLVLACAAALLVEPYLLPKMHDRYFFSGNVFLLLLAMMRPSLWAPVVMTQIAALIVAYPHLYEGGSDRRAEYYMLPVLMMTISLIWVFRMLASPDNTSTAGGDGEQP